MVKRKIPVFVCPDFSECWGYWECLVQGWDPDRDCAKVAEVEVEE